MLTDFYAGNDTDAKGRTFGDLIAMSDDELRTTRDYVPYLFPIAEESRAYRNAPILTKEQAEKFVSDTALRDNVKISVNRFLTYLHGDEEWRQPVNSAHAKISQMIRFLKMIKMDEEVVKIIDWCSKNGGSLDCHKKWQKLGMGSYVAPWDREPVESDDPTADPNTPSTQPVDPNACSSSLGSCSTGV